MDTIQDFEDMLELLDKHRVKYLIIGGLAFIYHAKPRYTKDIALWIDSSPDNIKRANGALSEFGSPILIDPQKTEEILQLGVAPDRIDFLLHVNGVTFEDAWKKRLPGIYGTAKAKWIDIDSLIQIKRQINNPRHQEDVRVFR